MLSASCSFSFYFSVVIENPYPEAAKKEVPMKKFPAGKYDIAVIGAGHAGIEAALAAARLGQKTICFTINLDAVGNMPWFRNR